MTAPRDDGWTRPIVDDGWTRPIVIRLADSGESFEFNPPDDLWLDMLAYCDVTGLSIAELIVVALEEGLPRLTQ